MIKYLDADQDCLEPGVVCLGFFDGVHLGHQAIICEGKKQAERLKVPLYVHTYDVPPMTVIKPGSVIKEISPLSEKVCLLEQYGADIVAISKFDHQMMHMSGADFFLQILIKKLQAEQLIVGTDHRFGFKGKTDSDQLSDLCRTLDIGLSIVPDVSLLNGKLISSTAIRKALSQGDINTAEKMLGRPVSKDLNYRFANTNDKSDIREEYVK